MLDASVGRSLASGILWYLLLTFPEIAAREEPEEIGQGPVGDVSKAHGC
jgi:hypothetical protein